MEPWHLRLDFALSTARSEAVHDAECPEIGPICAERAEPAQQHHTTLWLTELRAVGELGLLDGLALQAVVPFRFVGQHTAYTDLSGTPITLDYVDIHHRNELLAGIGDPQLMIHHARTIAGLSLGVRAGVSVPLGVVHENPYELGDEGLPHEHIQFGTGTFDPLLALDVTRTFGETTASAWGYTQLPLYAGSRGYQAGTRIVGGLTASTSFGTASTFRLGLAGYHERPERWDGHVPEDDGNRGRSDAYVAPGVTFPVGDTWSLSVDLRARVWGEVEGAQLSMPLVAEVSIGRLVHPPGEDMGDHDESPATAPVADVRDVVLAGELAPLAPEPGRWTLFDFWAPWCTSCVTLDLELRRFAAAHPGVALRRVNIVDFESPIATRELPGVTVLPHVRLVAPDGTISYEASGAPTEILREIEQQVR